MVYGLLVQDVDAVRHARVLGAGDHPEQRLQQGDRLVVARHLYLRNARRVTMSHIY